MNETSGATPDQLRAALVSAAYFRLFGATVARGRTFTEEEDRPGGAHVAVISHHMWTQALGGTDIAGRALRLNGVAYVVIGVLDPAFRMDDIGPEPDLWLPLQLDAGSKTQGHFLWVCGRLRHGVTLAQARAHLGVSANQFRTEFPDSLWDSATFTAQPVREAVVRNARPLFLALLGAVALVLLIACSNIAALLLLQGAVRAREIAVRAALGAGRSRIVCQLFTETLLLSAVGGARGLALGCWPRASSPSSASPASLASVISSAAPDWRVIRSPARCHRHCACRGCCAGRARIARRSERGDDDGGQALNAGAATPQHKASLVGLQVSLAWCCSSAADCWCEPSRPRRSIGLQSRPRPHDESVAGRAPSATTTVTDAVARRGIEALRAVPDVTTAAASSGLLQVVGDYRLK